MATPTAGLIVLKQPRTGSTWLKAELNALPGVFLRFEPLSDMRFNTSECAQPGGALPELRWRLPAAELAAPAL